MASALIGKIVKNVFIVVVSIVVCCGLYLAIDLGIPKIFPDVPSKLLQLGMLVPLFFGVFCGGKLGLLLLVKQLPFSAQFISFLQFLCLFFLFYI